MTKEITTIRLRPSAGPIAFHCTESINIESGIDPVDSKAADLGTAFHDWAQHLGKQGEMPQPSLIAKRHKVDGEQLSILVACGWSIWKFARGWLEKGQVVKTEETIKRTKMKTWKGRKYRIIVEGTLDRLTKDGEMVRILDWKTGRAEGDHTVQLRLQAWLAFQRYPDAMAAWCAVGYVRSGEIDAEVLTRQEVMEWWDGFVTRLLNGVGEFRPGTHCEWCARAYSCAGRRQFLTESFALVTAAVSDADEESLEIVPLDAERRMLAAPKVCEMLDRVKTVEAACKRFRDAVREDVMQNGPLPNGNGKALQILDKRTRSIKLENAIGIITAHLGGAYVPTMPVPVDVLHELTISASKVEDIVTNRPGERSKKDRRQDLVADMMEAGCMKIGTRSEMRLMKYTPPVQEDNE